MRTAAIVHDYPSVTETFVAAQITGLVDLGCDVTVFADGADRAVPKLADVPNHEVVYFGLPFKRLRDSVGKARSLSAVSGGTPRHEESRGESGVTATALRSKIEGRAFGSRGAFDVIHAHFGPNGVRAVRQRRRGSLRGPVVTSFYGYDVGRRWSRGGYAELFAEGERFLALSRHMKDALAAIGCPEDRIDIHPLGVDLSRFPASPKQPGESFEIISVARLVPKKGIADALEAVAALAKRNITFRYTIVGDGPLRQELERRVRTGGLGSIVRFLGSQPHARVAELLRGSDVLLAPSLTAADGDAEGTPVAILEAQASGIPIVSTLHAGIPEIVDDGRSGFLVGEGDTSAMAERLHELHDSPSLRATMGLAGRAIVTGNHDIRSLNAKLLHHYNEVRAGSLRA